MSDQVQAFSEVMKIMITMSVDELEVMACFAEKIMGEGRREYGELHLASDTRTREDLIKQALDERLDSEFYIAAARVKNARRKSARNTTSPDHHQRLGELVNADRQRPPLPHDLGAQVRRTNEYSSAQAKGKSVSIDQRLAVNELSNTDKGWVEHPLQKSSDPITGRQENRNSRIQKIADSITGRLNAPKKKDG